MQIVQILAKSELILKPMRKRAGRRRCPVARQCMQYLVVVEKERERERERERGGGEGGLKSN